MPIKAVDFTPREFKLDLDPTGDTWIKVRPRTWSDDLSRGEFLRNKTLDGFGNINVDVNSYVLWELEIWLTYDSCNVSIEREGEDPLTPFEPREKMDRASFIRALREVANLVPDLPLHWHSRVLEVNKEWAAPL